MAAEAVHKVKEAEERGRDIRKRAGEEAKRLLAEAREQGAAQKKSTEQEARQLKKEMLQSAVKRADENCRAIEARGTEERAKLLAPEASRMERAIQLVMERIVSA